MDRVGSRLSRLAAIAILGALTAVRSADAQIAVRLPDENLPVTAIRGIHGQIWLATPRGAYRVIDGTARRIPDEPLPTTAILDIRGQIWLATDRGAYRVTGETARRIPDEDVRVWSIHDAGGHVWVVTDMGAYRVTGDTARRIPDDDLHVWEVYDIGGHAWLATDRGAYRVSGDTIRRFPDEALPVRDVQGIGGQVWLATERGAYRVSGETARRIPVEPAPVMAIHDVDGEVWLGTRRGAYRVTKGVARRMPDEELPIVAIHRIGGQVWLATARAAYRVSGEAAIRVPLEPVGLRGVYDIGGQAWLATDRGAYRVTGETVRRFPDETVGVNAIQDIGGQVWLATSRGAYRIVGDTARRVSDEALPVKAVRHAGGQVWLMTDAGAYRVTNDTARRIPDQVLRVWSIEDIGGQVWLATDRGAYWVDQQSSITVVFRGRESLNALLARFLPEQLWLSGIVAPLVRYSRPDGGRSYGQLVPRFHLIVATDPGEFAEAVRKGEYIPAENLLVPLASGPVTLRISVRDQWHNTFSQTLSGWAVPAPPAAAALLGLLWGMALLLVVGLAPFTTFCHDLLMNPWLRKYGSFGAVPLALTVLPPLRRHVLGRYLRGIRQDEDFAEMHRRFVVPDDALLPEQFGRLLQRHRVILLLGQPGIGKTSYAKYLLACLASHRRSDLPLGRVTPVLVPLGRYRGEEPSRAFHAQLANYGRFTDMDMTAWFLQQGGFLIVVDGLNEVDEATRAMVDRFVDQHWKANWFCLTSQEPYQEFARFARVEVAALRPHHVREVLQRRLGEARAGSVIAQFTEDMYDLYKLPHDLELAMAVVAHDRPVPTSRPTLYQATLAPVLASWQGHGRSDYSDLLYARAYEMLRNKDTFFDPPGRPWPDDLREPLVEARLLVPRGEQYLFRHDLVRAYLAALHFGPRWRERLAQEASTVDTSWRPMLEFVLLGFGDGRETKELVFALLGRNSEMARDLFRWGARVRPELCQAWAEDFARSYGAAMLR